VRCLNVGCGTGRSHPFRDYGADVNLDVELPAPGVEVPSMVLGDVRALPFRDGAFDAVLCFNVLEHVREWRQALRECIRVARRYVLLRQDTFWNIDNWLTEDHEYIQHGLIFLPVPRIWRWLRKWINRLLARHPRIRWFKNKLVLWAKANGLYWRHFIVEVER